MSFICQSHKLFIVVLGAVLMLAASPAMANLPELSVSLADTNVSVNDSLAWISVYLQNYQDTLAGFTMRVILNRPDIMEFRTDVEDTVIRTRYYQCTSWYGTVCMDSVPLDPPVIDTLIINQGIDTVGSMVADWEQISVRSLSPTRHDIKVTGLANNVGQPYTPGILPRPSAPGLLMRLNVRIYEDLPEDDSTVTLYIIENLSETNFSDPGGNLIGTVTKHNVCDSCYCETWDYSGDSCFSGCLDTLPSGPYDTLVIDTFFRYWICQDWGQDQFGQDSCLEWGNYSDPDSALNADSISIDSLPWTVWNQSTTSFTHGELSVVSFSCICGDANSDDDISVGDPVFLINYIFKGGQFPQYPSCCDVNNDNDVNVGDVVYMINYIFKGGPAYDCGF